VSNPFRRQRQPLERLVGARARTLAGLLCCALLACGDGGGSAADVDGSVGGDAAPGLADGPTNRVSCTRTLGTALGTGFGRLDGYLATVLAPGHVACPSDTDHVHLQVRSLGATYDVAITAVDLNGVSVDFLARDAPLPAGAWAEGWHSGVSLDYVQLGLHDTDFQTTPKDALVQQVDAELAAANHVSIFSTAYPDHTGAHKVHRNGGGEDGALIVNPTGATARLLLFHFATQSF
jgi:hypothetical protein